MKLRTAWTMVPPLTALTGLGVSHLLAAATNPAASPLLLVGDQVILLTPTPLKTWAIETLGTADKPVLLASIGMVVLLLAALAGRQLWANRAGLYSIVLTLAAIPLGLALFFLPLSFTSLLPSLTLVGLSYGILRLWDWLLREKGSADETDSEEQPGGRVSRRVVLLTASASALIAGASGLAGQAIMRARLAVENIRLPAPVKSLEPKVSNFDDVPGITPLITPVEDFYRVDINLSVPLVDHNEWRLEIKREGYDTVSYSYEDILAMDLVERDITLICVSNSVGGEYTGSGRWLGVDLATLLEPFEPETGYVDQLFATSVDGYTSSSPLKYVMDGREGMLVVGYNGEVLTREHGFPARLLIPGLYGFIGATKWVETLELTRYSEKEAYWTKKDWATDAPVRPLTRIDVPSALAKVESAFTLAGVAWAGTLGVEKVEVAIDGGSWQAAEIDDPRGPQDDWDYWVQWRLPVELDSGSHQVQARCVTKTGEVQEAVRREPFPSGASGVQSLSFTVN